MRIELDVPESAVARGDPGAIRQILINVLDNAAKYGPIGQTIIIGVRKEGKLVRLWVDDSGPGIPASDRDKVWKPFFRMGGTVDDSTGGAGLGLSIVRDLQRRWGERISPKLKRRHALHLVLTASERGDQRDTRVAASGYDEVR